MRSLDAHVVSIEPGSPPAAVAPGKVATTSKLAPRRDATPAPHAVQRDAVAPVPLSADEAHVAALTGIASASAALPHAAAIQASFGHHDVGGVRAAVGGPAADASAALGARAYASGDAVAFASAPDLHLAAHEAAHVVQQRGGVRLAGGIGQAGDRYEQHADAVADRVVRGESAEALLDTMAHRGSAGGAAVQKADAPAPAAPAPAAPAAAPAAAAAPASATAVPPEVLARVGADFVHTDDVKQRRYHITPGGGFLLTGTTLEFRSDNTHADAWKVLAAYVVAHQADIAPTAPAAAPAAPGGAAPAADPSSVGGAIGAGVAAVGAAIGGAFQSGVALLSGGVQIVEDAISAALGGAPDPSAAGGTASVPPSGDASAPAPAAATPAAAQPAAPTDTGSGSADAVPLMSQFTWYGLDFKPLHVDDVFAVAQVLSSNFGIGGTVTKVTAPTDDVRSNNPNQGFYWFKADGSPTWNGTNKKSGGTQYVTFTIADGVTSNVINPLTVYLAKPGPRGDTIPLTKGTVTATPEVKALNLRNIPGKFSCFATSSAMMTQAGVTAVDAANTDKKGNIISLNGFLTITDESHDKKTQLVDGVTPDPTQTAMAKAYFDFALDKKHPVLTGLTYKSSTLNDDNHTDHWVLVVARSGNTYTFNDPADGSQGQLTWDEKKFSRPYPKNPQFMEAVSWVRPNVDDLPEFKDHWAQPQQGSAAPGAAAPAAPAAAAAKSG